jgi:hypothetical protein
MSEENDTVWYPSAEVIGLTAAIEIDSIVMSKVWVFAGIHTARLEPDLAFLFINLSIARTTQLPLVIWFFNLPVTPS